MPRNCFLKADRKINSADLYVKLYKCSVLAPLYISRKLELTDLSYKYCFVYTLSV